MEKNEQYYLFQDEKGGAGRRESVMLPNSMEVSHTIIFKLCILMTIHVMVKC